MGFVLLFFVLFFVMSSGFNRVLYAVPTLQSVEWQEYYADAFDLGLHFCFA